MGVLILTALQIATDRFSPSNPSLFVAKNCHRQSGRLQEFLVQEHSSW